MRTTKISNSGNSDTIEHPFSTTNNSSSQKGQCQSKNNTIVFDSDQKCNNLMIQMGFNPHEDIGEDKNTLLLNCSEDYQNSTLNEYVTMLNSGELETANKGRPLTSEPSHIGFPFGFKIDCTDSFQRIDDEGSSLFKKKHSTGTNPMLESSEVLSPTILPNSNNPNEHPHYQYVKQKTVGSLKDIVKYSFQNKFQYLKNSGNIIKKAAQQTISQANVKHQVLTPSQSINIYSPKAQVQMAPKFGSIYQSLSTKSARNHAAEPHKESTDNLSSMRLSNNTLPTNKKIFEQLANKENKENKEKLSGLIQKNLKKKHGISNELSDDKFQFGSPTRNNLCTTNDPSKKVLKKEITMSSPRTIQSNLKNPLSPRGSTSFIPKFQTTRPSPIATEKQVELSPSRSIRALVSPRNSSVPNCLKTSFTGKWNEVEKEKFESVRLYGFFESGHCKSSSISSFSLPQKKLSPSISINLSCIRL